jgi:hypothetical protein
MASPLARETCSIATFVEPRWSTSVTWRVLARIVPFLSIAVLAACAGSNAREPQAAGRATADGQTCDLVVDPASAPTSVTFATIQAAIDAAPNGGTICVTAGVYVERAHVRSGGTPEHRLVLTALGTATTEGVIVTADNVSIVGFDVTNPSRANDIGRDYGISLAGRGLIVERNHVRSSAADGIGCEQKPPFCPGAVVEGAEGAGIVTYGDAVLIEGNDVSGSTSHHAVDADGIRFHGADVVVRANRVHDITAAGYPAGTAPHTDCFQTFPKSGFVPRGNLVVDNLCVRVDDQCLVADGEGDDGGGGAGSAVVPSLEFRGNICENVGSQAILSRRLPNLRIVGNWFDRGILYWGLNLQDGAHHAVVTGNTFLGRYRPVLADSSSEPGLVVVDNVVLP